MGLVDSLNVVRARSNKAKWTGLLRVASAATLSWQDLQLSKLVQLRPARRATEMQSVLERSHSGRKTQVPAGTILLTEGTKSGRLYVLAEGSIEVMRGETQVAVIREPGAFLGEMSVLLDLPHTATVRTVSSTTLYAFDDAEGFLRSDPEITLAVARTLAQRLNAATTYLVDLKRQYAGHGNHLGMVSDVLASLIHNQERDFTPGSDRQPDPTT